MLLDFRLELDVEDDDECLLFLLERGVDGEGGVGAGVVGEAAGFDVTDCFESGDNRTSSMGRLKHGEAVEGLGTWTVKGDGGCCAGRGKEDCAEVVDAGGADVATCEEAEGALAVASETLV